MCTRRDLARPSSTVVPLIKNDPHHFPWGSCLVAVLLQVASGLALDFVFYFRSDDLWVGTFNVEAMPFQLIHGAVMLIDRPVRQTEPLTATAFDTRKRLDRLTAFGSLALDLAHSTLPLLPSRPRIIASYTELDTMLPRVSYSSTYATGTMSSNRVLGAHN